MKKYAIGIDIGTSGTKTAVFTTDGKVVADATFEYPLSQPQNGWAEQDPAHWWDAVVNGLKAVTKDINPDEIGGIGLSGQMHGLVMLDQDGEVLRPSIIWCDQRTAKECEEIEARVGKERLIEITANPALTGFTASKILWVRNNQPEIYAKCCHILLPKDYIRYMLTGEFATEVSDASGMQLLDIPNRCWSQEVLDKLEIDINLLGKVYESPEITGYVKEKVANETGLVAGIPVVGGAGDNAAAAVGTGCVRDGRAFVTVGTSGVVFQHSDDIRIDPKGRVHTFCCAVPGAWHVMGVTQAAGLSLRWFRDTFCKEEILTAEEQGIDPYIIMDEMAHNSPVGANRLLFLPYLMGERTPHLDPDARGVFLGISAIHEKKDFIRAVMEGVSFSLADCLKVFEEMGTSPSQCIICGGGGKSPLWRSIIADAFNLAVSTTHQTEGPALGAAILAMAGTGMYPDVPTACDAIVSINKTVNPTDGNAAKYKEIMPLYNKAYSDLKDTFKLLGGI